MNSTRKNARDHVDDLRGASRLAIDATRGVTQLVEAVHTAIARGPVSLGRPFTRPVELTSRLVYSSIRGDGLVTIDSALGRHTTAALTLRLAESNRAIIPATSHLDLLSSNAVYAKLRSWLSSPRG